MATFLTKTEVTHWGSSGPDTSRAILFPIKDKSDQYLKLLEDLTLNEPFVRNGRRVQAPVEKPIELSEVAKSALEEYAAAYAQLQEAQKRFYAAKAAFKASDGGKELATILVPEKDKLTVEEVWSDEEVKEIVGFVESHGTKVITVAERDVIGHSVGSLTMIILDKHIDAFKTAAHYKEIYTIKSTGYGFIEVRKKGLQYPAFRAEDYKEITKRDPC